MAKIDLTIAGKDKASGSVKGVTKSIVLANLATQALTAGMKKLINVGKEAIKNWAIQEKAENDLRNATGMNIEEFKKYASEMQNVTTVGDEVILGTLKLASTMGIANDKLTEAADKALSLSKAMNIDMGTAMKLVAAEMGGNVSMLTRYIPALKGVTDETEQAAIVNKVYAKGMAIARGEVETFGGRLKQLENKAGDASEEMGRLIAIMTEDISGGLLDALDPQNIREFAADFVGVMVEIEIAIDKFMFMPWVAAFDFIKGQVPRTLGFVIRNFQVAGEQIWEILKAALNPFDEKKLVDELATTLKRMKFVWLDYGLDVVKLLKGQKKEYSDLFDWMRDENEKLKDKILGINKKTNDELKKNPTGGKPEDTKIILKKKELAWNDYVSAVVGMVGNLYSALQNMGNTFSENALTKLRENLESQLDSVDENTEARLEAANAAEETRLEAAQARIASLQSELASETDLEKKADLQQGLNEAQSEAKRIKILDEGEKKKEKIRKDAAKKEKDEKMKAFIANKLLAIATVWVNAASAIIGFWAAYASIPIAGPILAAALTGVVSGLAAIQTGVIAAQMPSFDTGGVIAGTDDRVQINALKKERVLTEAQNKGFEELAFGGAGAGSGTFNIENMTVVADDPETFREKTIEQARFEAARG